MSSTYPLKKVSDLCMIISGQSPKSSFYNSDGIGLPFYQGKKNFTEKHLGEPTCWTKNITKEAIDGDILMSVRAPVGPVNITTRRICIGRGLTAIRPNSKIDNHFLFYYLKSIQNTLVGSNGTVFNSINKKQIGQITIPFPSLPEQQRIVKVLDEAFAAIDKAIENTEKNIQMCQELFESYLNEIFVNPTEDWEVSNLKKITNKIGSGATPRGGKASYKKEGISLIRSLNVHDLSFREKDLAHINNEQADKLSNVILEDKDVLLNITGASIARCCVVPDEILPARVNQHVSIIRPVQNTIISEFLQFELVSNKMKQELLNTGVKNGSTRQALTKKIIENINITYPSIKKQISIVDNIIQMQNQVILLKRGFFEKKQYLEELKQSLLQKAFNGGL